MQAGTCATPGASAATLPALTADANGKASVTGAVLFRGAENVALTVMTDGAHTITVMGPGGVVACCQIPALEGDNLPATGASTPWLATTLLLGTGVLMIGGGVLAALAIRGRAARQGQ